MNKIFSKIIVYSLFGILLLTITFCTDQYDNHALAFRNNTNDSIQVDRYSSNSIKPRTIMIAPAEYGKFYETSSDLWITPQVELQKICDSIIVTGKLNEKTFRLSFTAGNTDNYCLSPYSESADWELLVIVNEEPKFLGKTLERFNIHIFDIKPACITVTE